jgi:hypothetical protein
MAFTGQLIIKLLCESNTKQRAYEKEGYRISFQMQFLFPTACFYVNVIGRGFTDSETKQMV